MFRLNKRGGLVTDREALHASRGYKRQIDALAKLHERGDEMSAMTLHKLRMDIDASVSEEVTIAKLDSWTDVLDAHLTAHAQMVEKVRGIATFLEMSKSDREQTAAEELRKVIGDGK